MTVAAITPNGPAHPLAWGSRAVRAGTRAVLPSASELLCALSGQYVRGELCELAYALVELHRHRREWPLEFNCRRAELVADVNAWAVRNLPHRAVGARKHEESLGEFMDRIAAVAAHAFYLLMTDDVTGTRMHAAWTRLAELEVGYSDLLRDVHDGRRYLPASEDTADRLSGSVPKTSFPTLLQQWPLP
ncbi:DUF4254 domain-containing protein [Nocardia vinacea]|uniref:DUF4254 domain-containing protein n=1 Tax=Nocardia vinacea TaxID=96468 RepID=UPI002E0FF71C|nr:DUF4254 domain-containing protein [Nocardia vinacea]